MSRPRYYWYGNVKKMIMKHDILENDRSLQASILRFAIEEAMDETAKLPHGEERIQAIDDILFKNEKSYESVAREFHYEQRTIQGWITSFVNLVGKKAGY